MPSRNIVKDYAAENYYHIYARGGNKQKIFLDATDYRYFLSLFERYLSESVETTSTGIPYPNFKSEIMLYSYCLMSNHYHLLVYQKETDSIRRLMRSIMTSYSRYFNQKYRRTGPVFESRYKASRITSDEYLTHITRYIHMNPRRWLTYRYSSLKYYLHGNAPHWLNTRRILAVFQSREDYLQFLNDYESEKSVRDELKYLLADS